jgi:hypothetical protein
LNARQPEVLVKRVNENRYLLHSILRGIQELIGRDSVDEGEQSRGVQGPWSWLNGASVTRAR